MIIWRSKAICCLQLFIRTVLSVKYMYERLFFVYGDYTHICTCAILVCTQGDKNRLATASETTHVLLLTTRKSLHEAKLVQRRVLYDCACAAHCYGDSTRERCCTTLRCLGKIWKASTKANSHNIANNTIATSILCMTRSATEHQTQITLGGNTNCPTS